MVAKDQIPLALPHRPALGQEDFLIAPCNAEAVAWIDRWPDWPSPVLTVYGPPGCGKTHLLHVWCARARARILSPRSLLELDLERLLHQTRTLAIEEADSMVGHADQEEQMLHLYNLALEKKSFLLLAAAQAPARWGIGLPDLLSRLKAAPAVAIGAPDDSLLSEVMVKMFADHQLVVSPSVLAYLMTHMERSFASARQVVSRLNEASLALKRPITVPLARDVLQSMQAESERGGR